MKYRQGITHCMTHDNKMPCAECAKAIIENYDEIQETAKEVRQS